MDKFYTHEYDIPLDRVGHWQGPHVFLFSIYAFHFEKRSQLLGLFKGFFELYLSERHFTNFKVTPKNTFSDNWPSILPCYNYIEGLAKFFLENTSNSTVEFGSKRELTPILGNIWAYLTMPRKLLNWPFKTRN